MDLSPHHICFPFLLSLLKVVNAGNFILVRLGTLFLKEEYVVGRFIQSVIVDMGTGTK